MEVFDLLKQRLVVGIAGAIFMIAVLFSDVRVISFILGIMTVIGLSEIYNATGMIKKHRKLCMISYVYMFITYIIISFVPSSGIGLAFFVVGYALFLLIYMVFNHEECSFDDMASLLFQTLYVSALFAHIILVRKLTYGNYLIWFIFITAWLSDTAAYAVGMRYGRNKLIPEISPKKTVEGALGGLVGCILFNLIYGAVCSIAFDLSVNFFSLIVMSAIAGVMSQLGDLSASCIKREYNLKDYSNLLPGHGGILDRFDSVLFVAPIIYYFVVIFPVIA